MLFSIFNSHVPKTVECDITFPYTEINGYKFHTETYGKPESIPVIVNRQS